MHVYVLQVAALQTEAVLDVLTDEVRGPDAVAAWGCVVGVVQLAIRKGSGNRVAVVWRSATAASQHICVGLVCVARQSFVIVLRRSTATLRHRVLNPARQARN